LVPARLFLGFGELVEKFEVLLSVSTHPPPALKIADVLLRVGAGLPSEQSALP